MNVLRWPQAVYAWVRGFMFGAAQSWLTAPLQLQRRADLERMWMVLILSELSGTPLAPADLRLRLLPYVVPHILYWERRLSLWDEQLEVVNVQHLGH